MASDLIFNGTLWGGRTGSDRWGTFYTQVQPVYQDDSTCFTLDKAWGSRMVEMSGRIRGLSGVGTLPVYPTRGTIQITFPIGYFQFIPIVDSIFLVKSTEFVLNPDDYRNRTNDDGQKAYIKDFFMNPRDWNTIFYQLRNITNTGFFICAVPQNNYQFIGPITQRIIYWNAFGV